LLQRFNTICDDIKLEVHGFLKLNQNVGEVIKLVTVGTISGHIWMFRERVTLSMKAPN
jgi:hypothetical protein